MAAETRNEKRKHHRIESGALFALFDQDEGRGSGVIQNISCGGALLLTRYNIDANDLEILIKIPPFKIPLHARTEVVWSILQDSAEEDSCYGIKFLSANKNLGLVLEKFADFQQDIHAQEASPLKPKKTRWWKQ